MRINFCFFPCHPVCGLWSQNPLENTGPDALLTAADPEAQCICPPGAQCSTVPPAHKVLCVSAGLCTCHLHQNYSRPSDLSISQFFSTCTCHCTTDSCQSQGHHVFISHGTDQVPSQMMTVPGVQEKSGLVFISLPNQQRVRQLLKTVCGLFSSQQGGSAEKRPGWGQTPEPKSIHLLNHQWSFNLFELLVFN